MQIRKSVYLSYVFLGLPIFSKQSDRIPVKHKDLIRPLSSFLANFKSFPVGFQMIKNQCLENFHPKHVSTVLSLQLRPIKSNLTFLQVTKPTSSRDQVPNLT